MGIFDKTYNIYKTIDKSVSETSKFLKDMSPIKYDSTAAEEGRGIFGKHANEYKKSRK